MNKQLDHLNDMAKFLSESTPHHEFINEEFTFTGSSPIGSRVSYCEVERLVDQMGTLFLNRVADQLIENRLNLAWSLRPIFYSMRVFGIDLQVAHRRSALRRWGFVLLATAISFSCISTSVAHFLRSPPLNKIKSTEIYVWNLYYHLIYTKIVIKSVAMLEMATLCKWKSLWQKMRKLEKFMRFSVAFKTKLRKISFISTVVVIFTVTTSMSVEN